MGTPATDPEPSVASGLAPVKKDVSPVQTITEIPDKEPSTKKEEEEEKPKEEDAPEFEQTVTGVKDPYHIEPQDGDWLNPETGEIVGPPERMIEIAIYKKSVKEGKQKECLGNVNVALQYCKNDGADALSEAVNDCAETHSVAITVGLVLKTIGASIGVDKDPRLEHIKCMDVANSDNSKYLARCERNKAEKANECN